MKHKMVLIADHPNAEVILVVTIGIGIKSRSSSTSIPPSPLFFPSLISLVVSVDVKYIVYLLCAIHENITTACNLITHYIPHSIHHTCPQAHMRT